MHFVGKAGCYAVVVIADDAIPSLALNRMATFRVICLTDHINHVESSAAVAQPVEHLTQNHEIVGSIPTPIRIFSQVCAHFSICGLCELFYLGFG